MKKAENRSNPVMTDYRITSSRSATWAFTDKFAETMPVICIFPANPQGFPR